MKSGLIFDLDGTLWCASTPIAKGWNKTFEHFAIEKKVTPRDIESVAGHPFDKCVEALFPDLNLSLYPDFIQFLGIYEREFMEKEGGTLYQGVREGVQRLVASHKLYIVSNCSSWYLEMFLKEEKKSFQDWDCHGLSLLSKSEMIKRVVEKHKLTKACYIGDTAGDEKASLLAGLPFVHVEYGYGKPQHLPYKSFKDFSSLVDFFSANPLDL